jgi:hypothetical protein
MPILTTGPTYDRDPDGEQKFWKLVAFNATEAPITVTIRVFELIPGKELVEVDDSPKHLDLKSLIFDTISIATEGRRYTSVQIEHPLGLIDVQVNLYGLDSHGNSLASMVFKQKDLIVIENFIPVTTFR